MLEVARCQFLAALDAVGLAGGLQGYLHADAFSGYERLFLPLAATAKARIIETAMCQRLVVEPWAYLQDVLTRLPELPAEQLDTLLPDRWEALQLPPSSAGRWSMRK